MLILMQKITKESNLTFKLWDMTDSESKFKDISSITVNTNAISSILILNIEKFEKKLLKSMHKVTENL